MNRQEWLEQENERLRAIAIQAKKLLLSDEIPVWSFRPTPENLEWLEEDRWDLEDEKPESDGSLLNRKLAKLRELERQGF